MRAVTGGRRVCVMTFNRADYAPLRPLLLALDGRDDIDLSVVVSGAHLAPQFGMSADDVVADGWRIDARIEMLVASDTNVGMAKSFALGVSGFVDALERIAPAVVVLLGDRYEALAAAVAAFLLRIPIAHIAGGQVTSGVIDDSMRHAVSKLALLHFTATAAFRRRLIQLGEAPERVHAVGALGVDNVLRAPALPRVELEWDLRLRLRSPVLVVTYHPAPHEGVTAAQGIAALLAALDRFPAATVVFTRPNPDAGADAITTAIAAWVAQHEDRARCCAALGARIYPSLLAHADVAVGNTSSGLIEAPALGVPTVNVGVRQDGRPRAPSVLDAREDPGEVAAAITTALSPQFRSAIRDAGSPYGDGHAAARIAAVLATVDLVALLPKRFLDLPADAWDATAGDAAAEALWAR